ncbi:MAG TPA: transporter [Beijerinckiaceae bacterium]|nr:transporter [Beijerinckiaceae bacterium]
MSSVSRRLAIGATAIILAASLRPTPAAAVESFLPYLAGLAVGVPVGVLPPPGLYFANDVDWVNGTIRNGDGHSIAQISAAVELPQLLYAPGVKILGASYAFLVVAPSSVVAIRSPAGGETATGIFNPYVGPLNLSWKLRKDLFVSASFGVYLPVGSYDRAAPLNIANNFATFEPALGVTYLKDGWDLSASFRTDFNTENTATHYYSGDLFTLDATAVRTFGKWTSGLGGYIVDQFTNDTIYGVALPASPSIGLGRRVFKTAVGPILGYNFGKSTLQISYLRDVVSRNYGGGDNVFLRFTTALE